MFRYGWQCVFCLALLSQALFAQAVVNNGFEAGSLTGWTATSGIAVGSTAHSGSYGLTMPPNSAYEVAYQDVSGLTPGETYLLTAWVEGSAINALVNLAVDDTQGHGYVSTFFVVGAGWQKISIPYTVSSTGTARLYLWGCQGSQMTTYWDDVLLTSIPPSNAGFETGALGPWQPLVVGTGSVAVGSTAHSGSYGLTMGPNNEDEVAYQDVFGLAPWQTYTVSAWVMASASNPVQLCITDTEGNGWACNETMIGTGWQQISQTYSVTDNGALRINLYTLAGSATAYWDDVQVVPVPPVNAGFESGSLAPWQTVIPGTGSITASGVADSGSVMLTMAPNNANEVAYQDVFGLTPGQTYTVSASVTASASNPVQVCAHDTQGNGWVCTEVTATSSSHQVSVPYTVTNNGAMRVHLYELAGSGTTYWTNVSVAGPLGSTVWQNYITADETESSAGGDGTYSQYYQIVNRASGLVLDVTGASAANGTKIQQWSMNGGPQQLWQLILLDNQYYEIASKLSGAVLDVTGGSTADGTIIQEWQANGSAQQQWQLVPLEDNYYAIENKLSGKVLDDTNVSTTPGTTIQQWDWNGGYQQQWALVAVGATGNPLPNPAPGSAPSPSSLVREYIYFNGKVVAIENAQ